MNRHMRRKTKKLGRVMAKNEAAAPRKLEGMQRKAADAVYRELQQLQIQQSDMLIGIQQLSGEILARKKKLQDLVVAALQGQGFDPQKTPYTYDPLTGEFSVRAGMSMALSPPDTEAVAESPAPDAS